MLTNEDYDLNARIRRCGGKIWFDPAIQSIYFARKNLSELAKQYYRYGYWKAQMLKRFPGAIRWRQMLPPIFVGSLVLFGLGAIFIRYLWIFPAVEIFVYTSAVLVCSIIHAIIMKDAKLIPGEFISIITMHFCWGFGFVAGMFARAKQSS